LEPRVVIASYNDHCSAPFSRALVGCHHQSLLGRESRHCYGINCTNNWVVSVIDRESRPSFLLATLPSALSELRQSFYDLNSATFAKRDFAVQHRQAPGADKVKLLSLYHRFVIALHSPDGVVETGLRVCPPEKSA
jgi:hypothetical protein